MKYIKTFENFKPIKINSHKPFKVKKNLQKSILYAQKHINGLKKMLDNQKDFKRRSEINKNLAEKKKRLKDLSIYKLKQAEYLKNNPIDEGREYKEGREYRTLKFYWTIPCDDRLEDALVTLFKSATHYDNIVHPIDNALGFAKNLREKLKKEDFVYFRADIAVDFKEDKIINSGFYWCQFGDIYKRDLEKMGYVYAGEINTTPEEIEIKTDAKKYNL